MTRVLYIKPSFKLASANNIIDQFLFLGNDSLHLKLGPLKHEPMMGSTTTKPLQAQPTSIKKQWINCVRELIGILMSATFANH